MAYSNVTPPPLPEYDTEIYGFYILVFSYEIGAEDWYSVQLRYAPWRFSYDEALGITNGGNNFLQVYGDGTWGDWGQNQETLAIKPGQVGKTYQRIYTNHNIFDANDEIYMAADTILPPDENRFPILDFINGLVMALCGRPIQWPSREPVAWETLYENDVTFTETAVGVPPRYRAHIWSDEEPPAVMFYEGETIRFTADGVAKTYTVKLDKSGKAYFGNRYLSFDEIEGEGDTGDDFSITLLVEYYGFEYLCFARNPGAYKIKIERRVN